MTAFLRDSTLAHLRDVAEWPDLGPRYEITGRLGRGGMSTVFAARDRTLDREVAIKVLVGTGADDGLAQRLLDEAHILARLEHPGIVPVHDAGTLPDGRVFYAMKLVRGHGLHQAIVHQTSAGDRLALVARLCDAVSFAHAHGIVHRDLKPENVMVGPFGEVLVMDWGVARRVDDLGAGTAVSGTPGFMAPEQEAELAGDGRVDVFGLGALLRAILPAPMPRPLAAIAAKATAAEPRDRYPSVDALAADLT
ncbi:MAG: serine/threonine protein kinase, partial [Acidobacteria bacterium]|nr:serine/threonine protein kinase [Acidobacteriota bacterium]